MSYQAEIEAVKRLIYDAFADLPYPGDDNLAVKYPYIVEECEEIKQRFRGKHWSQIKLEDLVYYQAYFSIEAFRFYLPSYMIAHLNRGAEARQTNINILYYLCINENPDFPQLRNLDRTRFEGFTKAQGEAIIAFLKLYGKISPHPPRGPDPIQEGIDRALQYWEARVQEL